eukprot:6177417-Pleurochrysis_carterae.AAC.1
MASAYISARKEVCPSVLLEVECISEDVLTVAENATQPKSGCPELQAAQRQPGSPTAEPDSLFTRSSCTSLPGKCSSFCRSSLDASSFSGKPICKGKKHDASTACNFDRVRGVSDSTRITRSFMFEAANSNITLNSSDMASRTRRTGSSADRKCGDIRSSSRSAAYPIIGEKEQSATSADAIPKPSSLQAAMRAHRPNSFAVHIVDLGPMKKLPLVTVSTHILLWRFLPYGSYRLRFEKAPDTSVVRVTSTYDLVCFCCVSDTVHPRKLAPRLSKQHFWDWYRLVRDA